MINYKIILLGFVLFFALAFTVLAQEATSVTVTETINLDEDIQPGDLGISEPRLLPDNPFYFLKNWSRGLQSVFALNSVKKAELKMKFANERLMELKKMIEQNKNSEEIERAIKNYQNEIGIMEMATEKIKEKAEESKRVGDFLDKFIQQQTLHQRLLQKLGNQVPAEVFAKIEQARERHLEKFGEVMTRLENKEKIQERLEKNLQEVKGSKFKNFKNLEVLIELEEKIPEEAKEAIGQAQENALNRLRGDLEEMSPEDQEKFKDYLGKVSGDRIGHTNIIARIEGEELSENLRAVIEGTIEENAEEIEKEYATATKEKAEAQIKEAEDSLKKAEELIASTSIKIDEMPAAYRLVTKATEKLKAAKEALGEEKYGRAFGQAVSSESLSRNAIRVIELKAGFKKTTREGEPPACSDKEKPVCGTDRKIYQNLCFAKQAGVKIAYFGECQNLPCAEEGEKVNRNPLLGPTTQVCCEGLEEIRVSKSYSVCQKEGFETPCVEDEDCPLARCPGVKTRCVSGKCVVPRCANPVICIQVITPAKNPLTGECKEFPTPCDVPNGWIKVGECPPKSEL